MSFSALGWRVDIVVVVDVEVVVCFSDRGVNSSSMEKNAEKKIRGRWRSRAPITAVILQSSLAAINSSSARGMHCYKLC